VYFHKQSTKQELFSLILRDLFAFLPNTIRKKCTGRRKMRAQCYAYGKINCFLKTWFDYSIGNIFNRRKGASEREIYEIHEATWICVYARRIAQNWTKYSFVDMEKKCCRYNIETPRKKISCIPHNNFM
jgi:hypothetical protein